jgi:hypothetical protein
MRDKVLAVKRRKVGLNHRQSGIICDPFREPSGRSHDDAHVDTAPQELFEDAPARASGSSDKKNCLLCGHLEPPVSLMGLSFSFSRVAEHSGATSAATSG